MGVMGCLDDYLYKTQYEQRESLDSIKRKKLSLYFDNKGKAHAGYSGFFFFVMFILVTMIFIKIYKVGTDEYLVLQVGSGVAGFLFILFSLTAKVWFNKKSIVEIHEEMA